VSLTGFPPAGTSAIILSHIHEGGAGVNGPIRVDSGISPAAPVATPLAQPPIQEATSPHRLRSRRASSVTRRDGTSTCIRP
jgi:hypothetical protein